jgi:hypothetical protein
VLLKKIAVLALSIGILTGLSACGSEEIEPFWQGTYKRTVNVPKGLQGRCYEETLSIDGKTWHLQAVLHATYSCDIPYLELAYQGVLQEVRIKRDSDNKKLELIIEDIHLVAMVDLAEGKRQALRDSVLEKLSEKYVSEEYENYQQLVEFSADNKVMQSNYFSPLLTMAIPSLTQMKRMGSFIRQ